MTNSLSKNRNVLKKFITRLTVIANLFDVQKQYLI